MTVLTGLSAFPITPSDADGHVDVAALRKLVALLCAAGVDSIGLLGSTGLLLSRSERRRALDALQKSPSLSLRAHSRCQDCARGGIAHVRKTEVKRMLVRRALPATQDQIAVRDNTKSKCS